MSVRRCTQSPEPPNTAPPALLPPSRTPLPSPAFSSQESGPPNTWRLSMDESARSAARACNYWRRRRLFFLGLTSLRDKLRLRLSRKETGEIPRRARPGFCTTAALDLWRLLVPDTRRKPTTTTQPIARGNETLRRLGTRHCDARKPPPRTWCWWCCGEGRRGLKRSQPVDESRSCICA